MRKLIYKLRTRRLRKWCLQQAAKVSTSPEDAMLAAEKFQTWLGGPGITADGNTTPEAHGSGGLSVTEALYGTPARK